jgi:hypothetical protein
VDLSNNAHTEKSKLIEGLIIVGVAAIIIVVALFGTTLYASATAAIASVTAMVTSALTGTANLLTAWYYWAIATDITSYYVGWFWLATWISLFAYASFKIATSDKKKWMNLVGRGSNYLGIVLILFLVAQPLAVSYGATFLADSTAYTQVEYNLQDSIAANANMPKTNVVNGSSNTVTQTELYNAANDTAIIAALDFEDYAGTITIIDIYTYFNGTMLASNTVTKIVVAWNYVGTGNMTNMYITGDSVTKWQNGASGTPVSTIGNSGTWIIIPEVFQQYQIQAWSDMVLYFNFGDITDKPSDGDYFEFSIKFYETATVMSQATIMMWFAGIMALVDLIGLLYATGALQKYIL